RSQTPAVSRARVPARAEAPGKIETLPPKPEPDETIESPPTTLEAASTAENIETTPPPIEAAQAETQATEIADSGLAQPRDEGGERRDQR
ncbi:MAG TPA: hypothetical protein VIC60_14900, partial [Thermomicrobiales bacterium]